MTEARRLFCASLAKLVQPDRAAEAASALTAMLPMLAEIPEEAFRSKAALDTVARFKRRTVIPSYADIRAAFGEWWHDQQQNQRRLASPGSEDLDENDQSWLRYFRAREAEYFTARNPGAPYGREHVLSLVKQQSPKAHRRITGEMAPEQRATPTDDEKEYVANLLHPWREKSAPERKDAVAEKSIGYGHLSTARHSVGIPQYDGFQQAAE